jgi:peptidoglycan hydrolase FlgJ
MADVITPSPAADPAVPADVRLDAQQGGVKPGDAKPVDPKIWQAAKQFEAMAIGQLLAPMFNTVDVAHSTFGGGEAEATWQPMLVDAIGKQIEAHGGFGLAQPVYAAMLRAQEGAAHAGSTPGVTQGTTPGGTQVGPTLAGPSQMGGARAGAAGQSALRHVADQPRKPK